MYVADEIRKTMKERIDNIAECAKKIYIGKASNVFVEFGGWLLDMRDFSAVAFEETKVNVSYK